MDIVYRSPIQTPWVITKRADEAEKVKSLEEQVIGASETLEGLKAWAASVDKTLPAELLPKD